MIPRAALVGVGGYGKIHLGELLKLAAAKRIEFAAAVVVNPDETAAQLQQLRNINVPIYPSTGAMWGKESGKLDLVCLPVGIAAHEPLTVEALHHGANVLLEKPAAGSVAAVDRMIAARDAAGKFVAVGFQLFYQPVTAAIRARIDAGELGRIRRVAAIGVGPRDDAYYHRNNWAGRFSVNGVPVLDSPFGNAFAHYVNLALCWSSPTPDAANRVTDVRAVLRRARPNIEMFDNCAVNFQTASGTLLSFGFSHTAAGRLAQKLRIEGTAGTLDWDSGEQRWQMTFGDGTPGPSGAITGDPAVMFDRVLRRLEQPRTGIATLEIAREHVRAMEMLQRRASIGTMPSAAYRIIAQGGQYVLTSPVEKTLAKFFATGILPDEF